MEGKIIEARMIKRGQVFVTERGDVCMKLAYAVGAPNSAVSQEIVRAADLGNGDIYEFDPAEQVVAGPKAFDLYQLQDEKKELLRQLKYERDTNNFDAKRLRRLATLCGCSVPASDETMLGCAGTVIGAITRVVERLHNVAVREQIAPFCERCGVYPCNCESV